MQLTWKKAAVAVLLIVLATTIVWTVHSVPRDLPDYYRRFREKGEETRVYRRYGSVNPDTYEILCDLPAQDVELQHLSFSTEYAGSELHVEPYKADETLDYPMTVPDRTGKGLWAPSPTSIHNEESIAWYELIYNTTNNYYKFGLGYPIRFANGVRIRVRNPHLTITYKIACEVIVMIRG